MFYYQLLFNYLAN